MGSIVTVLVLDLVTVELFRVFWVWCLEGFRAFGAQGFRCSGLQGPGFKVRGSWGFGGLCRAHED